MRARIESAMRRRQQPRSLTSYLARTLVPRTVLFASLAAALLVGNAMTVDPLAAQPAETTADAAPAWTAVDAAANPGCVPSAEWPAGKLGSAVVAYGVADGASRRLAFDRAWELNHNDIDSDDLWVVGVCG